MLNENEGLYYANNKDVTWFVITLSSDVIQLISKKENINLSRATTLFLSSKTFELLEDTETGLWTEEPGYVADLYYEEQKNTQDREDYLLGEKRMATNGDTNDDIKR